MRRKNRKPEDIIAALKNLDFDELKSCKSFLKINLAEQITDGESDLFRVISSVGSNNTEDSMVVSRLISEHMNAGTFDGVVQTKEGPRQILDIIFRDGASMVGTSLVFDLDKKILVQHRDLLSAIVTSERFNYESNAADALQNAFIEDQKFPLLVQLAQAKSPKCGHNIYEALEELITAHPEAGIGEFVAQGGQVNRAKSISLTRCDQNFVNMLQQDHDVDPHGYVSLNFMGQALLRSKWEIAQGLLEHSQGTDALSQGSLSLSMGDIARSLQKAGADHEVLVRIYALESAKQAHSAVEDIRKQLKSCSLPI